MSLPSSNLPKRKRRRRWLQFSLRTMLLAMLVAALLLGWQAERIGTAWRQQRAVEAILALGGEVQYYHQRIETLPDFPPLNTPDTHWPPGRRWLRRLLGEHFFARAVFVVFPPGTSDEDLKHLDHLPYLTDIHLRGGSVTGAGLSHVWKHDKLRSLTLRSVALTDGEAVNLAALARLGHLDLCHTPITDETVETLSRLPCLDSLLLEGTFVSHEAARRLEESFPPRGKATWGQAPSEEQRQIAAALEREGFHVRFRRESCGTQPEYSAYLFHKPSDDKTLDLLERLEPLRGLAMAEMSVAEEHWARIAGSDASCSEDAQGTALPSGWPAGLTHLKTLDVHDVPLTDRQMRHIGRLVNLQTLALSDTRLTDAGLTHLAPLENLEELVLTGSGLTDAGLVHLGRLPRLRKLDLFGSQFTDDGLKHVGALSQLEKLGLWETQFTDDGLAHLAGLENLERLFISSPNVTDAGLVHVRKLTELTELWLYDGQVSKAGLQEVWKLPRLESCWLNGVRITKSTDELPMAPVLE